MDTNDDLKGVWVFGDYRNYFQNRVTLQLIAKAKDLADKLNTKVIALALGDRVHQWAMEYVAHGADIVLAAEHPDLKSYQVETYCSVVAPWVEAFRPQIFLAGATSFGREFFPRLAKRLHTGLSADCVALEVDPRTGLLLQTTPGFGGDLLAEIVTPDHRPQMATVHPGVFQEHPHNAKAVGRILYPDVDIVPETRVKLIRSKWQQTRQIKLEDAPVVVVGGRGLGSKEQFELLFELAELLEGEVGATRPVIDSGWTEKDRLLGQTGKTVKPKLLVSVGASGAVQYTTGILGSETIIAINRDSQAPIFNMADLGLVGDANTILPLLIEALRKRI
jgi:electron transfer flavoprotein alpha subunit